MAKIERIHFGKVRNTAFLDNGEALIHTTSRISAFDCILPFQVPGKAEILQAISTWFFRETAHIVPNHVIGNLNSQHMLCKRALVFPLEIVVRGCLTGSLWKLYSQEGAFAVQKTYGVVIPSGLKPNTRLPHAILTPTTKEAFGHDAPVDVLQCTQILERFAKAHNIELPGHVLWEKIQNAALKLFAFGESHAAKRGLALVDTKYEFGWHNGDLILVDEIHTPDCSRYWHCDDIGAQKPRQLSKEVIREEILSFVPDASQKGDLLEHPHFRDPTFLLAMAEKVSTRYLEMFHALMGDSCSPDTLSRENPVPWPVAPALFEEWERTARLPETLMIVGNGAREHALARFLSQRPEVKRIWVSPGQREWGLAKVAFTNEIKPGDVGNFARDHSVGLLIVGPDLQVAQGVADSCRSRGVAVVGPSSLAACLEASKVLCKEVARAAQVRTPEAETVSWSSLQTIETVGLKKFAENNKFRRNPLPGVLKYDSLAVGKGVFVCQSESDVQEALEQIRKDLPSWEAMRATLNAPTASRRAGEPQFLWEETLTGEEFSLIALCSGTDHRFLPVARDYKRRNNGQKGPNTGGMGTISPVLLPPGVLAQAQEAFRRTLEHMKAVGTPYSGFLFGGFMCDSQGSGQVHLLEFNCRLGDPETQTLLPGLGSDFVSELCRTAQGLPFLRGDLSGTFFEHDGLKRVFVVGSAPEYPFSPAPQRTVVGLEEATLPTGVHSIVYGLEPGMTTKSGRVLGFVSAAPDWESARKGSFEALERTHLKGSDGARVDFHFRTDIGAEMTPKT